MAERVADAAAPMPVTIVSSAPEVTTWATARGLTVIDDPGSLDAAAAAGVASVAAAGLVRAVIAHADLPHARSLHPLAVDGDRRVVVVVPCHREDGTNVLSIPVGEPFRFAYGPGSFARHVAEAERLGLEIRVLRAPDLVVDIDIADDLHHLDSACTST
jgi:2-phospho-L-lactate guanylyltransferase